MKRDERVAILSRVMAPDVRYSDPQAEFTGVAALADYVEEVLANWPGGRLKRTTTVDCHHGFARFGWQMQLPDGRLLPESLDVMTFDPESGNIRQITGFFGAMTPA